MHKLYLTYQKTRIDSIFCDVMALLKERSSYLSLRGVKRQSNPILFEIATHPSDARNDK